MITLCDYVHAPCDNTSMKRSSSLPIRCGVAMPTDRTTIQAIRAELDALVMRLHRLGQAGLLTNEQRQILDTIAGQLHDIRARLRIDSSQYDTVINALADVAKHVDGLATAHQDCAYGPVLTQVTDQITAAAKDLTT